MDWTEVKVSVLTEDTEKAGEIAVSAVPYGIYIEDYSLLEQEAQEIAHIDLIDEDLLKKDRNHSIIHVYISNDENPNEAIEFLLNELRKASVEFETEISGCKQEDWANNWKKYFKPFPVGKRLYVRPLWEDNFDAGDRAVLNIEPGAAFGTGSHDTTRLCLETLDEIITENDTVLDLGCGSGILAISSLLLGAEKAFGVDIDPVAVKTAVENGKENGFSEPQLQFVCGDLAEKVSEKYTVVVANIVADVIIYFSTQVKKFMADGGVFVTSGIIDSRADEVEQAIIDNGLTIVERKEHGGWVCFISKVI